jgi:hypothetical protein
MIPEIISIRHDDGSGFRAAWMDNESSFLHLHPEFEVVLNISGNGTRVAGDSVEIFDRYDLVMYGPDLRHFWNFTGRMKMTRAGMQLWCISGVIPLAKVCSRNSRWLS